jgi:formate dehydrogenase major subunit/formate dehydrogenase-N alpha subunit
MKDDRDAHFIEKNAQGVTVNRWLTTGMLCSSAASNETGILDGKFTRALGMVSIDCQARLCHGPTVSALAPTFGRGAMTNNWVDIKNANVVLIMGGNAAEAHPVGFKWVIEAKIKNNATVIVVDPRFNRSAAVADLYAPIRAGSDSAFLLGVIRYLIAHDRVQHEYVRHYTNASMIVREDYASMPGCSAVLILNNGSTIKPAGTTSWMRTVSPCAMKQPALRLESKQHVERYTPEMVNRLCGTSIDDFLFASFWPAPAWRIAPPLSYMPSAGPTIRRARKPSVPRRCCNCCWAISAWPAAG